MLTIRLYEDYDFIALQALDTDKFGVCEFSTKLREATAVEDILSSQTKSMSYLMKFSLSINVHINTFIETATYRMIMIQCAVKSANIGQYFRYTKHFNITLKKVS